MQIIKLTEEHKSLYENFVSNHNSGSFLQSWGWGDWQNKNGKAPVRYGVFDDGGNLIGATQLLISKVPVLPGYYLYAPYGPILDDRSLIPLLIEKIKNHFPDAWFIRFEPKAELNLNGVKTQRIQPGKTLVTDLTQDLDVLQMQMHPKTRYNINVAKKHLVTVTTHSPEEATAFTLIAETSKRQGFQSYPQSYYQNLVKYFDSQNQDSKFKLYCAWYQNHLVTASIFVDHGQTRTYLFGGSSDEFRNVMAPYALHWQAIQDAKQQGLRHYDWWGIETATGKTPGFVQFKLRWSGTEVSYPEARDFVLNQIWYFIYRILRKVNRFF